MLALINSFQAINHPLITTIQRRRRRRLQILITGSSLGNLRQAGVRGEMPWIESSQLPTVRLLRSPKSVEEEGLVAGDDDHDDRGLLPSSCGTGGRKRCSRSPTLGALKSRLTRNSSLIWPFLDFSLFHRFTFTPLQNSS